MEQRLQFSLRALLVATAVVGAACWLNRDAPFFAALGSAGALLCFFGDACLRMSREAKQVWFVMAVTSGAVSLAMGASLVVACMLVAFVRHVTFD
jgi:hypothetical protein